MLARFARLAVRRRRLMVFGIWIPIAVLITIISQSMGNAFTTTATPPPSESRDANELLTAINPTQAGITSQLVIKTTGTTVDNPLLTTELQKAFSEISALQNVDVKSPYDFPNQINRDKTIAFAEIEVPRTSLGDLEIFAEQIKEIADPLRSEAVQIEYGGDVFAEFPLPESEVLGLLAAIIILVLSFGSVLAMGLPIGLALTGLAVAAGIVAILSRVVTMADATTSTVAMIGIGVGIDYALFIVTRFREGLHDGLSVEDSIVEAVDTSGRAVIFAGTTVIIALLGLLAIGLSFVTGLAIGMAIAVAVMLIASITLLPSLIAMVGHRIDTTTKAALFSLISIVGSALLGLLIHNAMIFFIGLALGVIVQLISLAYKPLRKPLPHRQHNNHQHSIWWRWSRVIQRAPWRALIASVALLGTLALPLFAMRLGFGDYGNSPKDSTVRKAYDLIAEGFGPGFNGPLIIAVTGDAVTDQAEMGQFVTTLQQLDNVSFAGAVPLGSDAVGLVTVYPKSAPQDEATSDLVNHLRDNVIPASGIEAKVGGFTAAGVDFSDYLSKRLFVLIGIVLVLSFLLLTAVFRSVLVPLKAVLMNLLSVGAAYGVIVAVFQWGWAADLIGLGKAGPIEPWLPMFLFAIVFGLSMDYEVFLLSRMKEEYDRTGDNTTSVADGLAATARVITAAAAIMVCVFAAFVLGDDRALKLFGLGMAVAVFLDATIVRMLLVPATMELLGDRNWWIPKWLDRILPRIHVEGRGHEGHVIS
jgi:putative drug exporter of the RND superfamily